MVCDVSQIFLEYIFMKNTKDVDLVSFKKKYQWLYSLDSFFNDS